MKREWVRPQTVVEKFEANEYVAACGDTEYGMYKFVCDAQRGNLFVEYKGRTWELGGYKPCGKTHEAPKRGSFYDGFVDFNNNRIKDDGEAVIVWLEGFNENTGRYRDRHATTNLNQDSWETANS